MSARRSDSRAVLLAAIELAPINNADLRGESALAMTFATQNRGSISIVSRLDRTREMRKCRSRDKELEYGECEEAAEEAESKCRDNYRIWE